MGANDELKVLVIDDEPAEAEAMAEGLRRAGYACEVVTSGREGLRLIEENGIDIVLTDLVMRDVDGMAILERAKELLPEVQVVMISGRGTIKSAVAAMHRGAATYLTKPVDLEELRAVVSRARESVRLARSNLALRKALDKKFGFEGIAGESAPMQRVFEVLRQIAPTDARVLIVGESGTGKERVARAIHSNSKRANRSFIGLSCAALSDGIVESELFGHEKGAFTGAMAARKGRFEAAHRGTLFLDDVGDMPISTQIKLLRAIEEGEIVRVGSNTPIQVDVRLLAGTNRSLEEAVRKGQFREDLYFRLKVVTIELPPLRSRPGDVPLLINNFVAEFSELHGKEISSITPEARDVLERYTWPGNVRELKNCIESMVVITKDDVLGMDDMPAYIRPPAQLPSRSISFPTGIRLEDVERELIKRALAEVGGNREEAAKLLGIGERTLYRKLDKYGLK